MNALAGRIRLDFRADDPINLQIVRQIEALVLEGTLKPGDQLPTVRELAIDLRINFSTVARAYRILDEQRLISTQRGRGTYIWHESADPVGSGDPAGSSAPIGAGAFTEAWAGLVRRMVREALELGAAPAQIEQVIQQQLKDWQREHPTHSNSKLGG